MNDPYCVLQYEYLVEELMAYISHQKVMSSWMLGFVPYQKKPQFHCSSAVGVTHEWSLLCPAIWIFSRGVDGVYITSKGYEFMDAGLCTLPKKVRRGFV